MSNYVNNQQYPNEGGNYQDARYNRRPRYNNNLNQDTENRGGCNGFLNFLKKYWHILLLILVVVFILMFCVGSACGNKIIDLGDVGSELPEAIFIERLPNMM